MTGAKKTTKKATRKTGKNRASKKPAKVRVEGEVPSGRVLSVEAIAAKLRAKYGGRSIMAGSQGRALSEVHEVIPVGLEVVDRFLCGIGGLPGGRIIEVASEEGGCKTTLGNLAIASVQREGGIGAYIDAEHSYDRDRAQVFDVDTDKILLGEPESLEESLDMVWDMLSMFSAKRGPNVIVHDSIAAALTIRELAGMEPRVGEYAGILTRKLKRVTGALTEKRTTLLCINQVRDNLKPFSGGSLRTPGGRFFRHAASIRFMFFPGKLLKNPRNQRIGRTMHLMTVKNRFAPPFRKVQARFLFETGFEEVWSTVMLAKQLTLIPKTRTASKASFLEARAALGWPVALDATAPPPKEDPDLDADVVEDETDEEEDDDADE